MYVSNSKHYTERRNMGKYSGDIGLYTQFIFNKYMHPIWIYTVDCIILLTIQMMIFDLFINLLIFFFLDKSLCRFTLWLNYIIE